MTGASPEVAQWTTCTRSPPCRSDLALIASLVSVRLGVSVALLEIAMGVLGGNLLGLQTNACIDFLAGFGAVLLYISGRR